MANNDYVNRVDYGNETLIDISDTTAEAGDVIEGQVFYTRSGAPAIGTLGDATTSVHGLMSATDKTKLDGIATGATANVGTITGITMNGASKGTSGVVDLGTVITTHQDISGKADKSSTVSNVSYDSTNNKITKTINGTTSDVVTAATLKTAMSLENVENKSSATIRSEITSSDVTTALGFTPMNASLKGANNGVAELDSAGKVPASQLPSYVDDVLEYDKQSSFPATGETGKIYVAKDTNKTYRWSGTAYVEISPSLALGETSSTAYRGDRGKTAYDHASAKGSAFAAGLYKITTNSEGHVTAATAVAKSDITGLGIPGSDTNTHRPIQVNGTQILGDNTTALNLKAGSNVSVTNSSGTVTIAATDTTYSSKTAASGGTDVSLVTTGEKYNWSNGQINTSRLVRPNGLRGTGDTTIQTLISTARANRLAFLPADQIIIEKTVDGGTTWTDAGVSDTSKTALFSETRPSITLPQIDGKRNLLCGLRVTFSAMKYNVPSGTAETQKYNYWSSNYIKSTERYTQLKEFYFWISSSADTMSVVAQRATGANPNNWETIFNSPSFYMSGWSGADYISFSQGTFGGGTNQTGQPWNYRIIFMTKGVNGTNTLSTNSVTQSQSIQEIRGYGDSVWTSSNEYMRSDKLYSVDQNKNATFPARIDATSFNGYTIAKSVPSDAKFTDTTYIFDGTYNASTNKAATVSTVTNAINALDGNLNSTTPGSGKTLTAFSETNGVVSATFGNISITKSQVSDFPTSMTPTSHTHGNIQNGGTLQTNDVAIASGDKLVVTDSSDSNKVARTSLSFDGSTATKALTQKGTWESFTNNAGTITGIKMNGASKGTSGVVDLGTVITSHQDISGKVSGPASATNNAVAIFDGTGGKTIKNSGFTIGKSVPSNAVFTDTTYSVATISNAGLMSAADRIKLDSVALNATANVVSNSLSDTSTTNALSAAKGKALQDTIGNTTMGTTATTLTGAIAEHEGDISSLSEQIGTLINPASFTAITVPNGSVESGGYIKIGKIVILQARIRTTLSTSTFATGLPIPLNALDNGDAGVVSVSNGIVLNGYGNVVSSSALAAGVYQLTATYVCK